MPTWSLSADLWLQLENRLLELRWTKDDSNKMCLNIDGDVWTFHRAQIWWYGREVGSATALVSAPVSQYGKRGCATFDVKDLPNDMMALAVAVAFATTQFLRERVLHTTLQP